MRTEIPSLLLTCFIMSCYIASVGTAAEDADLVMYLTFDDDGDPEDASPKQSPIVSFIKPAGLVEGIEGNAWVFDDSTCILIDNATFEAGFQESTFSVWLKEPGEDGIIYEEGGTTKGFATSLVKGEVQFATRDASVQTTVGSGYPDDNDWHFITAVFDNGTMRLYIDGELMDETSNVPGIGAGHTNNMGIGAINGGQCSCGHSSKFTGIMDEFRITRRVLTAEEIQKAYQGVMGRLAVEASGKCRATWGGVKE